MRSDIYAPPPYDVQLANISELFNKKLEHNDRMQEPSCPLLLQPHPS